jgi:hypothetical protein
MTKRHYVNNELFLKALKQHKSLVRKSIKAGEPKPQIPNYIGQCILLIATNLSHKPSFINYPFRDEMISDGVENCLMYLDNFNPKKSLNPFAYFTQIIYYAFLRRIQKEKKQLYTKHKVLENSLLMNGLVEMQEGEDREFNPAYINIDTENMHDFIKTFEQSLTKKRAKRTVGIEKFIEETADEQQAKD